MDKLKILLSEVVMLIRSYARWFTSITFQKTVSESRKLRPISVNYHFTRQCNYSCGFCFHTAKTSYMAPLADVRTALRKLAEKGMKKINLAGGEPFLHPNHLGEICKFCKDDLNLESVSIVTNGSKVKKRFFQKYGNYVDIIAVSVDSFDEGINLKIGRGKGEHLKQLDLVSKWCHSFGIKFKINTVVNRYNHLEDLSQNIILLEPFRWKCFQVLQVDTENKGLSAIRDCSEYLITDEEFAAFCRRHEHLPCFIPESNYLMKSSYILLDEYLRFLSKGDIYKESESILAVADIDALLQSTDYEHETFIERGGVYDWTKDSACKSTDRDLDF